MVCLDFSFHFLPFWYRSEIERKRDRANVLRTARFKAVERGTCCTGVASHIRAEQPISQLHLREKLALQDAVQAIAGRSENGRDTQRRGGVRAQQMQGRV